MFIKTQIIKYMRKDEGTKYYLIDSDRLKTEYDGLSRLDTFEKLVEDGIINLNNVHEIGFINFINSINAILDGNSTIGRFKFFRVGPNSLSLEEQLAVERNQEYIYNGENIN